MHLDELFPRMAVAYGRGGVDAGFPAYLRQLQVQPDPSSARLKRRMMTPRARVVAAAPIRFLPVI